MKKLAALLIIMLSLDFTVEAQTVNYPFGAAEEQTLVVDNDTLEFTTSNAVCFIEVDADTSLVLNCTPSSEMRTGSILYLIVTADASTRYVTFGDDLEAAQDSVTANKTDIFRFIYYNSTYYITSGKQTN